MSVRALPLLAGIALLGSLIAKIAALWPRLPDRIAIHFNAAGSPDNWSSRDDLVIALAIPLAIFALGFWAVGRTDRYSDDRISLPHKAYWLAPERREKTFDYLISWMRWFLVLALALIAWVLASALEANLKPSPRLEVPLALFVGFGAAVVAMLVELFWHFARKA